MTKQHMDVRPWEERVKARLDAAPPAPRPRPEFLRETAKQRMHREQSARSSRLLLDAALAVPCPAGHAGAGEPCYTLPRGLCGARTQTPDAARKPPAPAPRRGTTQKGRGE